MRKGLKWGMKGLRLLVTLLILFILLAFITECRRSSHFFSFPYYIKDGFDSLLGNFPGTHVLVKEGGRHVERRQTLEEAVEGWKETIGLMKLTDFIILFIILSIIIIVGLKIRKGFRKHRIEEAGAKIFKKMNDEKLLKEIKSGERFIFEKDGKPAAAVVSMEDFEKIKNSKQEVELKKAKDDIKEKGDKDDAK